PAHHRVFVDDAHLLLAVVALRRPLPRDLADPHALAAEGRAVGVGVVVPFLVRIFMVVVVVVVFVAVVVVILLVVRLDRRLAPVVQQREAGLPALAAAQV